MLMFVYPQYEIETEMKRQLSGTYRSHQRSPVQRAVADSSCCRKPVDTVSNHHLLGQLVSAFLFVFRQFDLSLLMKFHLLQLHFLFVLHFLLRHRVDFLPLHRVLGFQPFLQCLNLTL